jgi:hypothetical protein
LARVHDIRESLGMEYRHEKFGLRYRVRVSSDTQKEMTMVFHHKMSARKHVQGITNLNLFLSLFKLYYQAARGRVSKLLIWTLSSSYLSFSCQRIIIV